MITFQWHLLILIAIIAYPVYKLIKGEGDRYKGGYIDLSGIETIFFTLWLLISIAIYGGIFWW